MPVEAPQSSKETREGQRSALRGRLLAGSAGYMSWKAITGALAMAASLLLYRVLGPEEAGRLQLALAAAMTVGAAAGLGFYDTLARFVPERGSEEGAGLFRRALRWNGWALAAGSLIFAAFWAARWGLPAEVREVAPLFLVFTAAYTLYTTAQGMLRGSGRLAAIPRLDLGTNFGAKVAALGAVAVLPGFVSAFAAHAAMQVVMLVVVLVLLRGAFRAPETRFRRAESRFGVLVMVGMLLQMLLGTVDLYVLRAYLGPEQVGIFAAGYRIPLLIEQLVLAPIGVPLLYYFSHPEYHGLREAVVRRGTRVAAAALGLSGLLLAALARPLVPLVLGEAYAESIEVTRLYAAHPLGIGLLLFSVPFYASVNRFEYGIVQGLVNFGLNLGLDLVLIPRFGPAGAAVAGIVSVAVTAVGASWFLRARFGIDIRATVAGAVLLYGLCLGLMSVVGDWAGPVAFAALLWPLRLLRREDVTLLRRWEKV
jgi:PST family polysaccharide transporter